MRFLRIQRGFTVAEVVVAMGILVLIASVVLFSLQAGKKKAYDAQRISDLEQLQVALRLFKDFEGAYPDSDLNETQLNTLLGSYLTGTIQDPKSDGTNFFYRYDASHADCKGNPILYANQTETGKIQNWDVVCDTGTEPAGGTDVYVIKL